jgi:hypothetical protein
MIMRIVAKHVLRDIIVIMEDVVRMAGERVITQIAGQLGVQ